MKKSSFFLPQSLLQYWFPIVFGLIILLAAVVRFVGLTQFPPSLYWEEAALGYDAYSILKTGKDHHGHVLPIVAFESFGDYKPSLYFYALVPSIALFGLSDLAVRIPSAMAGILLVLVIGLLSKEVFGQKKGARNAPQPRVIQLVAMAVAAVNPWAIQFSRGGWEVNLATCFVAWGVWFGLRAGKARWWINSVFAVILLVLSMYTYHATRLIAPLLLVSLGLYWLWQKWQTAGRKNIVKLAVVPVVVVAVISVVLASPLVLSLGKSQTSQRFAETSIFSTQEYVLQSNNQIEHFQPKWLGKIVFHRYWIMAGAVAKNYFSHLTIDFLFIRGDANPRHSTGMFGLFYPFEIVFLLLGVIVLIRQRRADGAVLGAWLVVGILPAALTLAAPHALRILPTMPVWIVIITAGILEAVSLGRRYLGNVKKLQIVAPIIGLGVCAAYVVAFGAFWDYYSKVYPVRTEADWQYGYHQVVLALAKLNDHTTPIYFTREQGRPAMYYWFYSKTDPRTVQAANATAAKDQSEFLEFENLKFINSVNEAQPGIIVSSQQGLMQLQNQGKHLEILKEIDNLSGNPIWFIYRLSR